MFPLDRGADIDKEVFLSGATHLTASSEVERAQEANADDVLLAPVLPNAENATSMKRQLVTLVLLLTSTFLRAEAQKRPVDYVNPFLGTAPLTNPADIGFKPPWRVWAGLVVPGTSVPNAMVQLSPITKFGSGAGYEYENSRIYAFAHTNKGHWNLCNIPVLPVSGDVDPADFSSNFTHKNESAHPGYYQVYLERYGINAELTSTLRTGYHRYTYTDNAQSKKLVVNLAVSNEPIKDWEVEQVGDDSFKGFQQASEKVFFYAVSNYKIKKIEMLKGEKADLPVADFVDGSKPVEIKIGLSFVSTENAKAN